MGQARKQARPESDWGAWFPAQSRDVEVERLERELEESRARERKARREAAQTRERFDRLLDAGRSFTHGLRELKRQQHKNRQRLDTQQAVGAVLAEAGDFEEAAERILKIVGKNLGWQMAVFWEATEDEETLRCSALWRRSDVSAGDFEAACRRARLSRGEGLPGRAWAKNKCVWAGDLTREGGLRPEPATAEGLGGALAFPVTSGNRSFGVIELLCDDVLHPDKDSLYTVGFIGSRLGQFAERRRSEKELRESEERLRLATEAGRVGVVEWNLRADESRCSDVMAGIFGYPPGEYNPSYKGFLRRVHPEDRARVHRILEEAVAASAEHELEFRIVRPDGEVRRVRSRGRVNRDEAGEPVRVSGVTLDITEQQRAEKERDRLRSLEVATRAEAAERGRISRDLHDRVAHSMGVVHQSLQLYGALAEKDPDRANDKLQTAGEMAKASLEATRNLSMELRRSETENGLGPALRDLLTVATPDGLHTELSISGDESLLAKHLRGQLYLILREAVRNAVRHSGCGHLTVGLDITPAKVSGHVEDDGHGFGGNGNRETNGNEEARNGLGISSMRERAALLEGAVEIYSSPGKGTDVRIQVPLRDGK